MGYVFLAVVLVPVALLAGYGAYYGWLFFFGPVLPDDEPERPPLSG